MPPMLGMQPPCALVHAACLLIQCGCRGLPVARKSLAAAPVPPAPAPSPPLTSLLCSFACRRSVVAHADRSSESPAEAALLAFVERPGSQLQPQERCRHTYRVFRQVAPAAAAEACFRPPRTVRPAMHHPRPCRRSAPSEAVFGRRKPPIRPAPGKADRVNRRLQLVITAVRGCAWVLVVSITKRVRSSNGADGKFPGVSGHMLVGAAGAVTSQWRRVREQGGGRTRVEGRRRRRR